MLFKINNKIKNLGFKIIRIWICIINLDAIKHENDLGGRIC
jgi:hypothetical protein